MSATLSDNERHFFALLLIGPWLSCTSTDFVPVEMDSVSALKSCEQRRGNNIPVNKYTSLHQEMFAGEVNTRNTMIGQESITTFCLLRSKLFHNEPLFVSTQLASSTRRKNNAK